MKTILMLKSEFSRTPDLSRIMNNAEYKVIAESDPHLFLFLLASGISVDLAIVDISDPEINGADILQSLRRMAPNLPVVVLTSQGSVLRYLEALSLGAYEYLTKPIPSHVIRRIVQAATNSQEQISIQHQP
jgi:DNA-binding NtrC family response regulator